jgi:hypothetical protein
MGGLDISIAIRIGPDNFGGSGPGTFDIITELGFQIVTEDTSSNIITE